MSDETRNCLGDMMTRLDKVNDSLVGTKTGSELPEWMDADYQWPSSQQQLQKDFGAIETIRPDRVVPKLDNLKGAPLGQGGGSDSFCGCDSGYTESIVWISLTNQELG